MPTGTVEDELLELENRYWQAIKDRDVEAAMRLTDFPCLAAGASGVGLIDKETFTSMIVRPRRNEDDEALTVDRRGRVRMAEPRRAMPRIYSAEAAPIFFRSSFDQRGRCSPRCELSAAASRL